MDDLFQSLAAHWFWLTLGVLLGAAEIVAPGFFLIWLSGAAILTGLVAWVLPISIPLQVGLFAVFSIVSVYAGRRWFAQNTESTDPNLNDRGARLIGESVVVVEAIVGGKGRVKVGDSVWIAKGADADVGVRLRVTGSDGAALNVEAS